jgi:1-acyl-sn-glycerol-3-phosphate acyltransferase
MRRGLVYAAMDQFILRALRLHFRGVYLLEKEQPDPSRPAIVFANHNYWWDAYLLHALARQWRPGQARVWMRELTPFPPFAALGALPFPPDNAVVRAATIRRTVRELQTTPALLFIFPEGDLHPAPGLLPFGRALFWLAQHLPEVPSYPAAIRIEQGIHQRPEARILLGRPLTLEDRQATPWLEGARRCLQHLLAELERRWAAEPLSFRCIVVGRLSVDENKCSGDRDRGPKPWEHQDRTQTGGSSMA